jgi:nucleoside diphosphate kinase/adenylate kinase family enzyme
MVRVKNFHANVASIIDAYGAKLLRVDGARNPKAVWAELRANIPRSCKQEVVLTTGIPGSGRSAFSSALAAANSGYALLHTGTLLKTATAHPSWELINQAVQGNTLVDAKTCAEVVHTALTAQKETKKFVLDGFARSAAHVEALHALMGEGMFVDSCIHINASEGACRAVLENRASAAEVDNALAQSASLTAVHDLYRAGGKLRVINAANGTAPHHLAKKASSLLRATRVVPTYERTFAMIKPDAVGAGSTKGILDIVAAANLNVIFTKLVTLSDAVASAFYGEHAGKPFFAKLKQFMTSGPVVVMVLEGTDAIRTWRVLLGPTNTQKAMSDAPESIRAKYGTDGTQNAAHGSDSAFSAAREINFWTNSNEPGASCVEAVLAAPADAAVAAAAAVPAIPVQDTFAMIKPGTSQMNYDEIMDTIHAQGFEVRQELKTRLTPAQAAAFYGEHEGKAFYEALCGYMCSGPIVALHLRREFAIGAWRHLIGPTNFEKARAERPDSLRAKFAIDGTCNACHGSDSESSARRELAFFFSVGGSTPQMFELPLGMTAPAAFDPVSVADVPAATPAAGTEVAPAADADTFTPPARYSSKVHPMPTISTADLLLMEAYANYDLEPIMKDLLQRLMVTRPTDVTGYALKTLAEIHVAAGKAMPDLPVGPAGGAGGEGSVMTEGGVAVAAGGGLKELNPIVSPRLQPGSGAL